MADEIPTALLAKMDQEVAKFSAAVDTAMANIRQRLTTASREVVLAHVARQYAQQGVKPSAACLLAVALVRLAEAEPVERRPRGTCSVCGHDFALRADGNVGQHLNRSTTGHYLDTCKGVGHPPRSS